MIVTMQIAYSPSAILIPIVQPIVLMYQKIRGALSLSTAQQRLLIQLSEDGKSHGSQQGPIHEQMRRDNKNSERCLENVLHTLIVTSYGCFHLASSVHAQVCEYITRVNHSVHMSSNRLRVVSI